MGKVKLNEHYVKLIKHLHSMCMNNTQIANELNNIVGHKCIQKITTNQRWTQYECPDFYEGSYLLFKLKREGKL